MNLKKMSLPGHKWVKVWISFWIFFVWQDTLASHSSFENEKSYKNRAFVVKLELPQLQ